MAITDIPEFVEVAPGDLIRAGDWNDVQRRTRNSIRAHRHTRLASAPASDTAATDEALQISNTELADGAVTTNKLGDNSVTASKLASNSVTPSAIQDGAVKVNKLDLDVVGSGTANLSPGETEEQQVLLNAPNTKSTVYLPALVILATSGSGNCEVDAQIIYRQPAGSSNNNLFIRLRNQGTATCDILWQVLTFGS